jgi:hypothetical protein
MAPTLTYPPKPQRGDAIAVLSPSWGGPAAFPLLFELGLARLRDEFGLRPVDVVAHAVHAGHGCVAGGPAGLDELAGHLAFGPGPGLALLAQPGA